jgi:hypothetical protein
VELRRCLFVAAEAVKRSPEGDPAFGKIDQQALLLE